MISCLGGATAVLAVTEPSISGRHGLERVAALAGHFGVPSWGAVLAYAIHHQRNRRNLPRIGESIRRLNRTFHVL